ncbi:unnamed protein product [Heligmosomoides polygyrus]|uniref:CBS domain-containing protein n=1 Tax=Heligmosomoides polygyrus TaxID=6339 RepID=A0A183FHG6_HELPZ|nr:unnamed protein product [Heligmosomoides polygyrus]
MNRRMLGGLMRQQKNVTLTMAELVENAMNLQVRRVRDVMTPIEKVFMLSDLTEINDKLKGELAENRHTRIPVFRGDDRNSVIGVLNVKDLLLIDDTLDLQIGTIIQLWHRSTLFRFVTGETPVAQLMLELKRGFPLAIVIDYLHDVMCYHIVGIVTLEDNLEEVIGEIYDEKDVSRALEMHMEAMTAGTPLQDIAINVDQDVQMKQSKSKVSKKSVDVQVC